MEEKKRILKMIEDGKITAEDGLKLLEVLDIDTKVESKAKVEYKEADDEFFNLPKNDKTGKMLYIRVKSKDGEKVKVNIPIEFIKIVGGASFCDNELSKHNIDMQKIIEAIDSGFVGRIVEVDSEDGDKVIIEIS